MKPDWQILGDNDRDAVRASMAFLNGRLAERPTIEWALRTTRNDFVKRSAILRALEFGDGRTLKEPWRTAWRLLEESWNDDRPQESSIEAYHAKRRIVSGERTRSLISSIVSFVRPKLQIEARSDRSTMSRAKRARNAEDLFQASLTSNELVGIDVYQLHSIVQAEFLGELAIALEGAVNDGIAIGRRLGWANDYKFWRLGQLYWVSYRNREGDGSARDVDQFHRGIAPSVKLLSAVVERLSAVNVAKAKSFVARWRQTPTPIHFRLWASLSLIPSLTSSEELSAILPTLDDRRFWDIHSFPEVAELRACRFDELSTAAAKAIELRIKKGPPKNFWPKGSDPDRVRNARAYWSAREYRRIEIAGNELSKIASSWLAQHIGRHQDLRDMASVRFDFLQSGVATWVSPQPDARFDSLEGESRLRALEGALATARKSWDDDPAERALDWIRANDNAIRLIADMEATREGGAEFAKTWDRLGWWLKAPKDNDQPTPEAARIGSRVLKLVAKLPDATLLAAIQGISYWFSAWSAVIAELPGLDRAWIKLWPLAVKATNASGGPDGIDLNEVVFSTRAEEPSDLDTLNVPVGHLIDVFLALCPRIMDNDNPFKMGEPLCTMRNLIVSAEGKAGLIGQHRLVQHLPYFLHADEIWARNNLIDPLKSNDDRAIALWRAIARRIQFTNVLELIGDQVATRVEDPRLGRDSRGMLVSSLVVEALHAFHEGRDPAVANATVQQTLRSMDDEVRAIAAQTAQRYLREMSEIVVSGQRYSAEELFRTAVEPFLKQVWPQERSLATRGVSAAFARLPASAGEAFAEAVDAIDPFLVPFDCWSMSDFDLWGDSDDVPKLTIVDTPAKAGAFLRLLDLTVGTSEQAVIPMDLSEALDQVQKVSHYLTHDPAFRRLATGARRR